MVLPQGPDPRTNQMAVAQATGGAARAALLLGLLALSLLAQPAQARGLQASKREQELLDQQVAQLVGGAGADGGASAHAPGGTACNAQPAPAPSSNPPMPSLQEALTAGHEATQAQQLADMAQEAARNAQQAGADASAQRQLDKAAREAQRRADAVAGGASNDDDSNNQDDNSGSWEEEGSSGQSEGGGATVDPADLSRKERRKARKAAKAAGLSLEDYLAQQAAGMGMPARASPAGRASSWPADNPAVETGGPRGGRGYPCTYHCEPRARLLAWLRPVCLQLPWLGAWLPACWISLLPPEPPPAPFLPLQTTPPPTRPPRSSAPTASVARVPSSCCSGPG